MTVRALLVVSFVGLLACAGMNGRRYSTPLSAYEGEVVIPAVVSVSESMGYEAFNHGNSVEVRTGSANFFWFAYGAQFVLNVHLNEVPPGVDLDSAYREAKVKADEVWNAAVQARQSNAVGATVVVPSGAQAVQPQHGARPVQGAYPQPQYPQPPQTYPPQPYQPQPYQPQHQAGAQSGGCRFSSDCASGNCRNGVCEGGGAGAPCTFSSDCPGGTCRNRVCMGGGGPGAPCSFMSDCLSSSCMNGACR